MTSELKLASISSLLLRTASRQASDRAARQRKSDSGSLVRVHRGAYVPAEAWQNLGEEDQHLAKVLVAHEAAHTPPVFSHISAAVLHGLAVYGQLPTNVHVTGASAHSGAKDPQIVRHRRPMRNEEVTRIAGVRCTSAERTLLDLALTAPPETSLVALDSYVQREFRLRRLVDWDRFTEWRAEMQSQLDGIKGARGIQQARLVFTLVDPRKDSVLESVSHLQLHRLGFEIKLQVPVKSPKGSDYFVDFELVGLSVFGECDGKSKYVNALLRAGLSAEEIVYREKRRQDWICGTTKKDLLRWGASDVVTPHALARRLQAFGVTIPKVPA